jgi:hypothetical protein
MLRASVLFAIAAVGSGAAGPPAAEQSVQLRYQWTKGDVLEYRVTLHSTGEVSGVPGRGDTKTEQMITQRITLTVDGVAPNGVASVHETVTAIRSESSALVGKIIVDTAKPSDDTTDPIGQAMSKMLAAVVGQPINIVITPDGTVRSIEGGSRLLERIAQGANADPEMAAASQALTSLYGDQAIRGMLEQSFPKLPPQPVKPGDTWMGQIALGNQTIGRIAAALTFTLKRVDGGASGRATVTAAMKLTQEVKPPAAGATRMTMALGDSRGEGELVFDIGRGRIATNTMRTEMPSTVTMIGPDGSPVAFHNRVKTNAAMELVEK